MKVFLFYFILFYLYGGLYSVELVLLNKHQVYGGAPKLH